MPDEYEQSFDSHMDRDMREAMDSYITEDAQCTIREAREAAEQARAEMLREVARIREEENKKETEPVSYEKGQYVTLCNVEDMKFSERHKFPESGIPLLIKAISAHFIAVENMFTGERFPIDTKKYAGSVLPVNEEYVNALIKDMPRRTKKDQEDDGRINALEIQ